MRGRDPFRIARAKHPLFKIVTGVCVGVSIIRVEADTNKTDRTDTTDVEPAETVAFYVHVATEGRRLIASGNSELFSHTVLSVTSIF